MNEVEKFEIVESLYSRLESHRREYDELLKSWDDEVASVARERIREIGEFIGWPADDDTLGSVVLETVDGRSYLRARSTTVGGSDGGDYWLPLDWWAKDTVKWSWFLSSLRSDRKHAKQVLRIVQDGPVNVESLVDKLVARIREHARVSGDPRQALLSALDLFASD